MQAYSRIIKWKKVRWHYFLHLSKRYEQIQRFCNEDLAGIILHNRRSDPAQIFTFLIFSLTFSGLNKIYSSPLATFAS